MDKLILFLISIILTGCITVSNVKTPYGTDAYRIKCPESNLLSFSSISMEECIKASGVCGGKYKILDKAEYPELYSSGGDLYSGIEKSNVVACI